MSILRISQLGDPVLRRKGRDLAPEEIRTPEIQTLIDDMVETMREADGIGLAAPQVYRSFRLAVVESMENQVNPGGDPFPLTILINPEVLDRSDTMELGWEGCLSIENLRGLVPRHAEIRVKAIDRNGETVELTAGGYRARVIQHELDHLDGILFLDRMEDLRTLSFTREFFRYWAEEEES